MARIGAECALCENTGTDESAVWSEISLAKDVTMNDAMDQVDISNRSTLFKLFRPGMRDVSIDFQTLADAADTRVAALETTYAARTAKTYALLDAKPSGAAKGTKITGYLFNKTLNEPLGEAATLQFTLKPSAAPSSLTITVET